LASIGAYRMALRRKERGVGGGDGEDVAGRQAGEGDVVRCETGVRLGR